MCGVLSFQGIRSILSQHSLDYLIIAKDVVKMETIKVTPFTTLDEAYRLFGLRDLKMIPVVENEDSRKVVGVIRKEDRINYYNMRLMETLRK